MVKMKVHMENCFDCCYYYFYSLQFQFSFFYIYLFIHFLAVSGLSFGTQSLRCGAQASLQLWFTGSRPCKLSSCCAWALQLWHAACLVVTYGLSSCGMRAQFPQGMWDLSSLTEDRTGIPCIAKPILNHWTTREAPVIIILNL